MNSTTGIKYRSILDMIASIILANKLKRDLLQGRLVPLNSDRVDNKDYTDIETAIQTSISDHNNNSNAHPDIRAILDQMPTFLFEKKLFGGL